MIKLASQVVPGDIVRFPDSQYRVVNRVTFGLVDSNRVLISKNYLHCLDRDDKVKLGHPSQLSL